MLNRIEPSFVLTETRDDDHGLFDSLITQSSNTFLRIENEFCKVYNLRGGWCIGNYIAIAYYYMF